MSLDIFRQVSDVQFRLLLQNSLYFFHSRAYLRLFFTESIDLQRISFIVLLCQPLCFILDGFEYLVVVHPCRAEVLDGLNIVTTAPCFVRCLVHFIPWHSILIMSLPEFDMLVLIGQNYIG